MKYLIVIAFSFLTITVLKAQDSIIERKLTFGLEVTPQLATVDFEKNNVLNGSKKSFNYSLGGKLIWSFTHKFQVHTGLKFQKAMVNARDYSPLFPLDQHNGEALPYLSYYEYEVKYLAISIPVGLSIDIGNKANQPYFYVGGIIQEMILSSDEKLQLIESGLDIHSLQVEEYGFELNKTHVYVQLGAGYEFNIGAKRKLSIGPEIDYSMNNYMKEETVEKGPVFINGNLVFLGLQVLYH
jgi:hypothetical protein